MAHHDDTAAHGGGGWAVLVLLCLAQFMLIVDITVVQVALPTIGADLGLDRESLTWVVTTYTLCFGGLMVLGGRLADAFGARRTLLAGLGLFTAASLVCGLAGSGAALVAGRAFQGVGAALLSPAALAVITGTFHGERRARALGVWAAIGGTGAALGVLVGGLLTAGPGWAWVFFVNVPIGLMVLAAVPAVVPAGEPKAGAAGAGAGGRRQPVDVPGALIVTLATALLIYGLVTAGDAGWAAAGTVLPLAGAVLLYVAFVLVERSVRSPLMRASTLARRPVISGTFVMLVATGLMLGLFFLSTLYLQHVLGFSALETGLIFLPAAVAITVGAQVGGHLIGRVGGRPVAVAAFVVTAAGAALMARSSPETSVYTTLLPGFVLASLGIGPAFVTATTTTMANIPPGENGVASGVINTFHELGGSIGVAVVSTVAAASLVPGAGAGGFAAGFVWCAVAAGVAGVVALGLVPGGKPAAAFVGHGHGHGHG
ncbi:drug resistance transporter, EmrB/QacA subfamily [[Actinomadura] parvosata subsp. kistnae]|uniref:MFS transporter n=1 Tax=[Actinomadura] parvosata subsp. kistnae TaxID=1909395 RepID=A0A1V0A2E1_9ACTN|nr:MFS transporter [Nonomuraea sp. ATCC 55076]AQZ64374.1 MFS transporter [Nonomuraea sp. ATCC 55076]SPL89150.1 drug resistance transporter, EmrB/QacA subfamily [Actinomadura parvosata subsp. kistnae]